MIKIITLLAMLTVFSCGMANADMDNTGYANSDSETLREEQERVVESMNMRLNGHLYEIQQNTSKMQFHVDSPIGEVWASFENFKGVFTILNSGVNKDSAFININADSLETDASFIEMLLKSESFFDVENFPSIHFVGSSFEWYNDTNAVLKGYMTIKDVTRQVAFYVKLVNANVENKYSERITVKATTTIRRSEFGIFTLLPQVSDNVNLYMSIDTLKKDTSISMI